MNWMVEATQGDSLNSNTLSLTHYTIHPAAVWAISVDSILQWLMAIAAAAPLGRISQRNYGKDETAEARIKVQEFVWDEMVQTICFRVVRKAPARKQIQVPSYLQRNSLKYHSCHSPCAFQRQISWLNFHFILSFVQIKRNLSRPVGTFIGPPHSYQMSIPHRQPSCPNVFISFILDVI